MSKSPVTIALETLSELEAFLRTYRRRTVPPLVPTRYICDDKVLLLGDRLDDEEFIRVLESAYRLGGINACYPILYPADDA